MSAAAERGMFPRNGVFPGQAAPGAQEGLDATCEPLFYPSRCNLRLDPQSHNSVISELINLMNCLGHEYDCTRMDNLCDVFQGVSFGNTRVSEPQAHTFRAQHPRPEWPNVVWREAWMERNGDIATVHVWNPSLGIAGGWDEINIESAENLVVLNNPVIYVNSNTGTANPPIESQADLTPANAFNNFNSVRNFMRRTLVVGSVTLDCRGTFEGTGSIGPSQFKNAQNIEVRGDPSNVGAFTISRETPSGGDGMIATGGNVTFRDVTIQYLPVTNPGSATGRNGHISAQNGTTLILTGNIRLTGTVDQSDAGSNMFLIRSAGSGTSIGIRDINLNIDMGPGHLVSAAFAAFENATLGIGSGVVLSFSRNLNATALFDIRSGATFNANTLPGTPPMLGGGSGTIVQDRILDLENLSITVTSGWNPRQGPSNGNWPVAGTIVNDIADYAVYNGAMGQDL